MRPHYSIIRSAFIPIRAAPDLAAADAKNTLVTDVRPTHWQEWHAKSRRFAIVRKRWIVARIVVAAMMLTPVSSASFAQEKLSPVERHGRALAERMCLRCHAIGGSGPSPRSPAPSFRTLENRIDLDSFAARLRGGLTSGHPDMPTFRFTREDARAYSVSKGDPGP